MAFSDEALYRDPRWSCEVVGWDHIIESAEKTRVSDEVTVRLRSFVALRRRLLLISDKQWGLRMLRRKVFDSLLKVGVYYFHWERWIEALGPSELLFSWKSRCLWGYIRLTLSTLAHFFSGKGRFLIGFASEQCGWTDPCALSLFLWTAVIYFLQTHNRDQ